MATKKEGSGGSSATRKVAAGSKKSGSSIQIRHMKDGVFRSSNATGKEKAKVLKSVHAGSSGIAYDTAGKRLETPLSRVLDQHLSRS